ncbi:hypothetical protein V6N12_011320 [Hibiscus sabdariffa]|uniref:Uncharacterized protein n=1 Tax=Hibiscus sabdariffa TaxID=183260 RepID=A0ABR1ZGX7_9ROSI
MLIPWRMSGLFFLLSLAGLSGSVVFNGDLSRFGDIVVYCRKLKLECIEAVALHSVSNGRIRASSRWTLPEQGNIEEKILPPSLGRYLPSQPIIRKKVGQGISLSHSQLTRKSIFHLKLNDERHHDVLKY